MAEPVRIHIAADRDAGPWPRFWSWFGYDEPNYTYQPHGLKLLRDLAALAPDGGAHVRAHNLLTSGNGELALKWGSTGVHDTIAAGGTDYSWTILDRIFDAYVEAGVTPFVQLGFMPRGLSVAPEPYRHDFPRTSITTGWAWPPTDYGRWGALVEAVARHFADRYGRSRAESWPWELWNEPDGLYWRGTVEEFCRLHDETGAALRRVLPAARFGGPHTCGPFSTRSGAPFLRAFLDNRQRKQTAGQDPYLDFIAFHAKGRPSVENGKVRMGLARQLRDIADGLEIVRAFPAFAGRPVILGESDPEGCAACPASTHPENAYRDGPLYAAYVAEALFRTQEIAARAGIAITGSVTWAFEFENTPFFAGYRELATNGIAKPVLNAFRVLGLMGTTRIAAESSGARALDEILADGVRGQHDINVLATRGASDVALLIWHYHDDQTADAAPVAVDVTVSGLPWRSGETTCEHYRIDERHSNAHAAWQAMGSPQNPSGEQYAALEAAGALARIETPRIGAATDGSLCLGLSLPRHALSLLRLLPS